MNVSGARQRFADARVARLATVAADGRPHLVPITFAVLAPDTIVSAVDEKPKRTWALRRLVNIQRIPMVAVLADQYDEDWSRLWWVRADGLARVLRASAEPRLRDNAAAELASRYLQYRVLPPSDALVVIEVQQWSGWAASA